MTTELEIPTAAGPVEVPFVRTVAADQTLEMCRTVLAARDHCRIGQITGEPGTGKSALTVWLADEMDAIRIECWTRISDKDLMLLIARACVAKGVNIDLTGTGNTLFSRMLQVLAGRLIIVDEANHLRWAQLEKLRSLSDLGHCGLVIVGTDILARTISTAGVGTYLAQFRQRIGGKRIVMAPIRSDDEFVAYCILPRFGTVTRRTAAQFRKLSGGVWRNALELGDTCERLMRAEGIAKLDEAVVQTAAALMAGA